MIAMPVVFLGNIQSPVLMEHRKRTIGFCANSPQSRTMALWKSADLFNSTERIIESPKKPITG